MISPLQDLATGSILARPAAFDMAAATGMAPPRVTSFLATDQVPQTGQALAKPQGVTLAEKLFDATATAKIWTAQVAMRLDRETRKRFFKRLDQLHDIDEWTDDGKPLSLGSYQTFVRSVISLGLDDRPALALMPSGNLLGIWRKGESKLSIEFRPGDVVRWVLAEPGEGRIDRIAGDTGLSRLKSELMLRGSADWFS